MLGKLIDLLPLRFLSSTPLLPMLQERAAGNGYTWTVVLCGLLLGKLSDLLQHEGLPLREVLGGLQEGMEACGEVRGKEGREVRGR